MHKRIKSIRAFPQKDNQNKIKSFINAELFLRKSNQVYKEWEELLALSHSYFSGDLGEQIQEEFLLVDQYCLLSLQESVASLMGELELVQEAADYVEYRDLKHYILVLNRLYRIKNKKRSYSYLTTRSTIYEKEQYSININSLKRRINNALYLKIENKKYLAYRQQFIYMLAAGFAGFWAILANILIWRKLQFSGFSADVSTAENLWGVGGFIVLAFIMAYILKDRIKDLGRSHLHFSFFGSIPDSSKKILYTSSSGQETSVGDVSEYIKFLKNTKSFSSELDSFRKKYQNGIDSKDKKIIFYRKKIKFSAKKLDELGQNVNAIRDVTRFSIRRHLGRLDTPYKKQKFLSNSGIVSEISLPKVYSLDILLQYTVRNQFGEVLKKEFDLKRVVLNKTGLVRLTDL